MTDEEYCILECPKCKNLIQIFIKDINCKIFRHAVYKDTNISIDPHASKETIEILKEKDLIYGCGTPLKLVSEDLIICDYV